MSIRTALWVVINLTGLVCLLLACSKGDSGIKVGDFCAQDDDCELGLCYESICLDPDADDDADGLVNGIEIFLGTDPQDPDTDGDDFGDAEEVVDVTDPADSDGDGLIDAVESRLATADPDNDCLPDQYDPHNEIATAEDLAPLIEECAVAGVCEDGRDGILAGCTDGVAFCDYSALQDWEETEATCDGQDNDCDGTTDEGGASLCDDSDVCTTDHACVDGQCVVTGTLECDDGQECSVDSCDSAKGCLHEPDPRPACRPVVIVDWPPRAARLNGDPEITVTGHVAPGEGGWEIDTVKVNGTEVTLESDELTFEAPLSAEQGMNLVAVDATDQMGGLGRTVQSFYHSTVWYPSGTNEPDPATVQSGLMGFFGKGVWDDKEPDLDDVASFFELVYENAALNSMVLNPISTDASPCDELYVDDLTQGQPFLSLGLIDGGLNMALQLSELTAHFYFTGPGCSGLAGTATANPASGMIAFFPSLDIDGAPVVQTSSASVEMNNFAVDGEGFAAPILEAASGLLKPFFESLVEDLLMQNSGPGPGGLVEFALGMGLAFLAPYGPLQVEGYAPWVQPVELVSESAYAGLAFSSEGALAVADVDVVAPDGLEPEVLGSIGRGSCPAGDLQPAGLPTSDLIVVGIHDDFVNRIAYSLFRAEALDGGGSGETLGIDLSDLGISDLIVEVDPLLPPLLSSCNPEEKPVLQIGDLSVHMTMERNGEPAKMQAYASIEVETGVGIASGSASDELVLLMQSAPLLDIEVLTISPSLVDTEGVLIDVIRDQVLVPVAETYGSVLLEALPWPSIDLSFQGLLPIPEGSIVSVQPMEALRAPGHTVVHARVQQP